jgi:hypothetical protein
MNGGGLQLLIAQNLMHRIIVWFAFRPLAISTSTSAMTTTAFVRFYAFHLLSLDLVTNKNVAPVITNHADAGVLGMKYNYTIKNDGTLDDLREEAKRFVFCVAYVVGKERKNNENCK